MKNKRILSLICSILFVATIFTGCNKGNSGEVVDVTTLKQKYSDTQKVEYQSPMYNLKRDYVFEIPVAKEIAEQYKKDMDKMINVYLDAELNKPVRAKLDYDESKGVVRVEPPYTAVYNTDDDKSSYTSTINDGFNVETKRENMDWGNANNYYLGQLIDYKTGEKLEKPKVTVFTIKPELDTPTVKCEINNNGLINLRWNKIEGAGRYKVFKLYQDGDYFSLTEVGETKDCTFNDLGTINEYEDMVISTNDGFDIRECELDENKALKTNKYCVMAINDTNKSLMSNVIDPIEYASNVPIEFDSDKNSEVLSKIDALSAFPTHLYVLMGDGTSISVPVDFDLNYVNFTESERNGKIVQVRYKARGTSLIKKYSIKIDDSNIKEIEEEAKSVLKELQDRQDKITTNALRQDVEVDVPTTPPSDLENNTETEDTESIKLEKPEEEIYASSALSEYIGLNLLNGVENISLKDFPEASNKDVLTDSLFEAIYQNPLVMSVDEIGYDYVKNELIIKYGQTRKEQEKQQKEVREAVDKAVEEIIKEDMTALEKEFAINKFLCDTAEYDDAALESALANDMIPDAKFNPSFTPYGVLVNKVGVCASYAGAFKLLADKAGLDCIVITGNLNGDLPHAWNRVKIEEEWMSVDSTNNDNDMLQNPLLNIPDSVAKEVLVEDKDYILDNKIGTFTGVKEDIEYYRYSKQYFDKEAVVKELVRQLKEDGSAMARTDYNLNDNELTRILVDVCKEMGINPDDIKDGYTWLGVISIVTK